MVDHYLCLPKPESKAGQLAADSPCCQPAASLLFRRRDSGEIDLGVLNTTRYITVRFRLTPGATLDVTSLSDAAKEVELSGDAADGVDLAGVPIQVDDTTFFRYPFTGQFGTGTVKVKYLEGSFAESDGVGGPPNTNVETMQSFELGPVMDFAAKAHVTINVTRNEQSVELPEGMLQYLPEKTLDSLTDGCYAVPAGAPHRDGTEGELTIADAFRLQGDFWMEVSEERFLLDASASLALNPLGAVTAEGYLDISDAGVVGSLQLAGGLALGPMTVLGTAQFEINTTDEDVTTQRYEFDFNTRKQYFLGLLGFQETLLSGHHAGF